MTPFDGLRLPGADPQAVHEVANQVPRLAGHDVAADPALLDGLEREGAGWFADRLHALGRRAGEERWQDAGDLANRYPPVLHTHDRSGHRVDDVEFHPAWHDLLTVAVAEGLAGALPWGRPGAAPRTGSHVARAAAFTVWSQVEAGHGCPVSMTYAATAALRATPPVAEAMAPLLTSDVYDAGARPLAEKRGALVGMGMTEKQGGSDVRANTTTATPVAGPGPGEAYVLRGHKWFTSAPTSDAWLVLAQTPDGLSCLLVPRVLPDGTRNRVRLQRLKDKLGNRSNASAEIELADAVGVLVGDEGRGVRTIIEMVALTRLDCVLGSTALQRAALVRALWHARHRSAFGRRLVDQPAMRPVLADLVLESEAATALAMRLAGAVDRAERGDAGEAAFKRIGLAIGKLWVCKRTPAMVVEALECLGGNGYVEDSGMPRLYREAPLLSIWEGSGTVNALDVLRALAREPAAADALRAELAAAAGRSADYDGALREVEADLVRGPAEADARRLVERLGLLLQASVLLRHSPVGEAFVRARLAPDAGLTIGALPTVIDAGEVVRRGSEGLPV
jgi:putative acyl-CoA dehydrogenase